MKKGFLLKYDVVCVSHHHFAITGGQARFDRLVSRLINEGKRVLWISPLREDFSNFENVTFLPAQMPDSKIFVQLHMLFFVIRGFLFLIQYRRKAVLVITFGETNLLAATFASLILRSPLSIGVRSNIHRRHRLMINNFHSFMRYFYTLRFQLSLFVWQFIYRYAAQIIVQSSQAKAEFSANFRTSNSKIFIIENDLPPHFKNFNHALLPDIPKRILFIGNGTPIKGFDTLVEAIPKFPSYIPSIEQVTIVGVKEKDFQAVHSKLNKAGIKIIWHQRHDNIPSLMKENDLLVVPSREDQFPNVVLEALAIGLPVIGSAVDGIKYMLVDDWILFSPNDPVALLECLSRVTDPAGYARAIDIAKKRASNFDFDWEERYITILQKATDS